MTLIVGRITSDGKIVVVGDTKLTLHNRENSNPFIQGCLKQYLLSSTLAIAFAGATSHFEEIFPLMAKAKEKHEIVKLAVDNQKKGGDFELLVVDSQSPSLTFVKSAEVLQSHAGFLGDKDAFEKFQYYYHETERCAVAPHSYSHISDSFRNVIEDEEIGSVGGVCVPILSRNDGLEFMPYAIAYPDPIDFSQLEPGWKTLNFGTREKGGFAVEFNSDLDSGGNGRNVSLYFLQGGFGVYFPESKTELARPVLLRAKNPAYWTLNTYLQFGIGMHSSFATAVHCGIAGEELMKEGRFQHALFCYELRLIQAASERLSIRDRYLAGYATALYFSDRKPEALKVLSDSISNETECKRCRCQLNKLFGV